MPIASRSPDGTAYVIDGDLVASLVGGRWVPGLRVEADGEGSVAAGDEDAVMLAMQARAALGVPAYDRGADLRGATL